MAKRPFKVSQEAKAAGLPTDDADFNAEYVAWRTRFEQPIIDGLIAHRDVRKRGVVPLSRALLRSVPDMKEFANFLVFNIVKGFIHSNNGVSLVNFGHAIGSTAIKRVNPNLIMTDDDGLETDDAGKTPPEKADRIRVGIELLDIVSLATNAFKIVQKDKDAPRMEFVDDGETRSFAGKLKMAFVYEIEIASDSFGDFITLASRFGSYGIPSLVTEQPRPWTNNFDGGTPDWDAKGLVHLRRREDAKRLNAQCAPEIFQAVNHLQTMQFKVDPVVLGMFEQYEPKRAENWLLRHLFFKKLPAKFQSNGKALFAAMRTVEKGDTLASRREMLSGTIAAIISDPAEQSELVDYWISTEMNAYKTSKL